MKSILITLILAVTATCAYAIDGQVLISQSSVMASGGFPYTISQPGSYKLTSNLVVPAMFHGIVITASNVTIDMNGFNMTSLENILDFKSHAISATGAVYNLVVKNGSFDLWDIAIDFETQTKVTVENLTINEVYMRGGTHVTGIAVYSNVHTLVKDVVTDGTIGVTCPSVIVNTIGTIFAVGAGCATSSAVSP